MAFIDPYKILIVDDEKNVLSSFRRIFSEDGYEIFTASTAEEGLAAARQNPIDLLIMDIKMPGMNGLEAFSKFKEIDPAMSVIIMTAYGTVETAVEAMQLGAFDYIIKPFEVPEMKKIMARALEAARLMKTKVEYEPSVEFQGDTIVGASIKMQHIYKMIGQIAGTDISVLLRGESGTGKELVARAIYHHSKRKERPFLAINSAAIPETLLESELFGYEKGAFTDAQESRIGKLEQCNTGTIFFDEIGDMPLSTQSKILRVMEDKTFQKLGSTKTIKVDVRLITATNRNLERLINEGKFREDLYYRLNVVTMTIPPLRERKEDIRLLVSYFIMKYSKELNKNRISIAPDTLKILEGYDWPGNVRELENAVKKALLFCKGNIILPEHIIIAEKIESKEGDLIKQYHRLLGQIIKQRLTDQTTSLYKDIIEETEKTLIAETFKQTQCNQSQVSKILGISRPTLKERINKLGLRRIISFHEE
ncbi:sigma-54-dependent Fis family transcriptional regulator [bacterium]|nr:sigma-54-dependent Fis family transcriptional regulator [bacterium]